MQRSVVLALVHITLASQTGFIGPVGPRTTTGTQLGTSEPPPSAGRGLSEEEVRTLLLGRRALVVAGADTSMALAVAEGLADVGASVVLACERPEKALTACDRINQQCAEAGDEGGSIEARPLDLSSAAGVWRFADSFLAEQAPLHVLVNCADDVSPLFSRAEGGWEGTVGRTHLGPFLLTQLVLDRIVDTMRLDSAAFAAAERAKERERERERERRQRRRRGRKGAGGAWAGTEEGEQEEGTGEPTRAEDLYVDEGGGGGGDGDGDGDGGGDSPPLVVRPYPAPLGRVVSLGKQARLSRRRPSPVASMYLCRGNYSAWRAYRAAHEANLLVSVQLSRLLQGVRTPCGQHVECNVVRPGGGRWLPRAMRRLLGTHEGPALTATFLASTPIVGMTGVFLDDFASQPPWRKTAEAARSAAGALRAT